jgi:hypothetical protein
MPTRKWVVVAWMRESKVRGSEGESGGEEDGGRVECDEVEVVCGGASEGTAAGGGGEASGLPVAWGDMGRWEGVGGRRGGGGGC